MTTFVLPFEKMHGLGNDFIFLERRNMPNGISDNKLAKLLCDRHMAIGADGIIIVDFPSNKDADFLWDYFNSDGSEGEMCGNGMRCFAKYVFERGFIDETTFKVQTKAGVIIPSIEENGTVTVNMGQPTYSEKKNLEVGDKKFEYIYVETGNPHCVIFLNNYINDSDFSFYGPKIEKHFIFPNRTNVEFAEIKSKSEINLRVWERGAGPTLACGTGACATLVAAHANNLVDLDVKVNLPGGAVKVRWDKVSNNLFLNGPASFVYTGQYNLEMNDLEKVGVNYGSS